jgi:hypothetical protein
MNRQAFESGMDEDLLYPLVEMLKKETRWEKMTERRDNEFN